MVFALTYGGIPLDVPRQKERELLARYAYVDGLRPTVDNNYWIGPTISQLATPIFPDPPPPYPGTFYYPTHASRWGWFCGLAKQKNKDAMVAAAFGTGTTAPVALPFKMRADDLTHTDNSGGITTNLFMLPPRPLGQTKSALDGMYLINLVDERYFFQFKTPGVWHAAQLTSWLNLVNLLATALGITITINDVISDDYLDPEPDSDLYTNYENAADLLDAVCWNIGCAPVRNWDGTWQLQRFSAADNPLTGTLSTTSAARPPFSVYRAFGGDIMDPKAANIGMGPTASMPTTWNAVLPASVTVTFPKYRAGAYYDPNRAGYFVKDSYGDTYPIVVTLASLGSPYSSFAGFNGTKVLQDTAKACYTLSQTPSTDPPTNLANLQPLAIKLAKDYYDLHLNGVDECYAGIRGWPPDSVNDLCFYFRGAEGGDEILTRVTRKPWNWGVTQFQHSFVCP